MKMSTGTIEINVPKEYETISFEGENVKAFIVPDKHHMDVWIQNKLVFSNQNCDDKNVAEVRRQILRTIKELKQVIENS